MEIIVTVLGSGCASIVPKPECQCEQCAEAIDGGLSKRTSPAVLMDTDRRLFLFDCGPDIKNQIKDLVPEAVFVSHQHYDHWDGVTDLQAGTTVYVRRGEAFKGGIKVEPFPVVHAKDVTTVGYILTARGLRIIYVPDFYRISDEKALKDVDLAVFDGKGVFGDIEYVPEAGHQSVLLSLRLAKKYKVKNILFVHFGHHELNHEHLTAKIKELADEAGFDSDNVFVAHDRMQLKVTSKDVEIVLPGTAGLTKAAEADEGDLVDKVIWQHAASGKMYQRHIKVSRERMREIGKMGFKATQEKVQKMLDDPEADVDEAYRLAVFLARRIKTTTLTYRKAWWQQFRRRLKEGNNNKAASATASAFITEMRRR